MMQKLDILFMHTLEYVGGYFDVFKLLHEAARVRPGFFGNGRLARLIRLLLSTPRTQRNSFIEQYVRVPPALLLLVSHALHYVVVDFARVVATKTLIPQLVVVHFKLAHIAVVKLVPIVFIFRVYS